MRQSGLKGGRSNRRDRLTRIRSLLLDALRREQVPGWLADSVAIALEELGIRISAIDEGKSSAEKDEATLARAGTLLDAVLSDGSVPPVAATDRRR